MAVDLDQIGRASLKELGDIRIDDVLSFIDRGIENMPSYMDLYRRWESQQWAVADLDFTLDREDWLKATDLERKSTLWSHRLFFNGEERVTATLAPFVWAAPTPEIEIFLSTQMVDEARHTVFFQRWWHEVVGTEAKDLGAAAGRDPAQTPTRATTRSSTTACRRRPSAWRATRRTSTHSSKA